MRVLFVGDVFGRTGRKMFAKLTKKIKQERKIDCVIVNGENSAAGRGISQTTFDELISGGADVITLGNHTWDNRDVYALLEREPFLIRPANYPEEVTGKGYCFFPWKAKNLCVVNLMGRAMMQPLDCPFQTMAAILKEVKGKCDYIFVDFHAEATSEKIALAFQFDGKIDGVVGTHTHVQTADERILPKGTLFLTDAGMTGAWNSVIGVTPESVLPKFLYSTPAKFIPAEGLAVYSAVVMDFEKKTIERILIKE